MVTPGFRFRRLEVRGRNKTTAAIDFADGLTVVSGASDTGKSYLVECLDFMTGARTPPDPIEESAGYESIWLEIASWKGSVFSLERSLNGGDLHLYECKLSDVPEHESELLKATKATKKFRSVSDLLLQLCELEDIKLLAKKKDGSKWNLTFRYISHLTIVNEERIYTKDSPVHGSGQYTQRTIEESVFRYLMTGVDDSSVIGDTGSPESASSRNAREEMLQEIIEATEGDLTELTDSPDEVEDQLEKIAQSLQQAMITISLDREQLREREAQRRELWQQVEKTNARHEVLLRLVDRFRLLERYYDSDLQRLGAMAEAGDYLGQLPRTECPICGTKNPWGTDDDLRNIEVACNKEIERIQLLKGDLSDTMAGIRSEIEELEGASKSTIEQFEEVTQQIAQQLMPAEQVLKGELVQLLETQSRLERASALLFQLERLKAQVEELQGGSLGEQPAIRIAIGAAAKASEATEFCKVVETVLTEWKFPDAGAVAFSEDKQDLVVNGKDRSTHGKGIRALSHAAFSVSLMRYCRKVKRSHPGFVVLDSPLVAYREPDSKQQVEEAGVRESFYRSLARKRKAQQIIVFENEDPPEDIRDVIQFHHFSGDKSGTTRSGFFPV